MNDNDLQLLPPNLAAQSLSPVEIVLPYKEALQAIEYLTAHGFFVFAWEGWIEYPDGGRSHSAQHQGTVEYWGTQGKEVQERLEEAASFARQAIKQSQQRWNDKPEFAGATLHFCLYVEDAK